MKTCLRKRPIREVIINSNGSTKPMLFSKLKVFQAVKEWNERRRQRGLLGDRPSLLEGAIESECMWLANNFHKKRVNWTSTKGRNHGKANCRTQIVPGKLLTLDVSREQKRKLACIQNCRIRGFESHTCHYFRLSPKNVQLNADDNAKMSPQASI